MGISNTVAVGLGMGTVFVCLICLVIICYITGAIVKLLGKNEDAEKKASAVQTAPPAAIANKGEFVSAIAVAIAEDLGTDVTGIRIKSIKKI